jgi:hypothetical protein
MKQRSLFARCPDWTESLSRDLLGLNQQVVRIWNIKSCSKLDENEGDRICKDYLRLTRCIRFLSFNQKLNSL